MQKLQSFEINPILEDPGVGLTSDSGCSPLTPVHCPNMTAVSETHANPILSEQVHTSRLPDKSKVSVIVELIKKFDEKESVSLLWLKFRYRKSTKFANTLVFVILLS